MRSEKAMTAIFDAIAMYERRALEIVAASHVIVFRPLTLSGSQDRALCSPSSRPIRKARLRLTSTVILQHGQRPLDVSFATRWYFQWWPVELSKAPVESEMDLSVYASVSAAVGHK